MDGELFDEMKRYIGLVAEDERLLAAFHAHARPEFPRLVDGFYQRLLAHQATRQILVDAAQIERLKLALADWLDHLLRGPWDRAYGERRERIGRKHVEIELPQHYVIGAMTEIRAELAAIADRSYLAASAEHKGVHRAIGKIIDLELSLMFEAYHQAYVETVQLREQKERSLLEHRLALSEARYEEIVEKSEALIATADADGQILVFNRRCEELTGIDRREASGRSWFELFVTPVDREDLRTQTKNVLAGGRAAPYEGPIERPAHEARRVRWHFTTLPGGNEPHLCAIGIDVTEEHALVDRTRRAERLAALGTMAAGLAHEIRNPLNAAHLQLTLAKRRLMRSSGADVNGALEAADLVTREMQRLARIVEEFLDFARPQSLRLVRGDLRETAQAVVSLMAPEASAAGVALTLGHGPPVPIELDDERLKQVVLNLIRNGIEASGSGGSVTVRVSSRGSLAAIEVSDDGAGIPSEDAPIFEPFWTTKPGGTGLGLTIVHRIVHEHGGQINVRSRPGRTVFTVELPLSRN